MQLAIDEPHAGEIASGTVANHAVSRDGRYTTRAIVRIDGSSVGSGPTRFPACRTRVEIKRLKEFLVLQAVENKDAVPCHGRSSQSRSQGGRPGGGHFRRPGALQYARAGGRPIAMGTQYLRPVLSRGAGVDGQDQKQGAGNRNDLPPSTDAQVGE